VSIICPYTWSVSDVWPELLEVCSDIHKVWWEIMHVFVANSIPVLVVKEFWKSRDVFWHTVCTRSSYSMSVDSALLSVLMPLPSIRRQACSAVQQATLDRSVSVCNAMMLTQLITEQHVGSSQRYFLWLCYSRPTISVLVICAEIS